MSTYLETVTTSSTKGLTVSNGPLIGSYVRPTDYFGSWYLNTATSLPNATGTAVASAASQWTLIPAFNNQNATVLLNAGGSFVAPIKGKWGFDIAAFMSTNASISEFQVWFIVTSASGQTSPRMGLQRQHGSSFNIAMASTSVTISLYKGDVVTPYINQISGATQTLAVTANGQTGSSAPFSTAGTVFTAYLKDAMQ
jgi:hypothetical protein